MENEFQPLLKSTLDDNFVSLKELMKLKALKPITIDFSKFPKRNFCRIQFAYLDGRMVTIDKFNATFYLLDDHSVVHGYEKSIDDQLQILRHSSLEWEKLKNHPEL